MWRAIIICLIGLTITSSGAAPIKTSNAAIKQQLAAEIAGLLKDLDTASEQLQIITQDNQHIKAALNDMESWGLLQQQEKDKYYLQAIDSLSETSAVRGALDTERAGNVKLLSNYQRLKSIMGCLFGSLLAIACFRLSSYFSSTLTLLAAPQLKLLSYLAPVACFGAGYLAVQLYF
jgi:hypothetical protein